MNDYDLYMKHGTIRGGDWVGFALAWKGLAGVQGLASRPHRSWYPWVPDPTRPEDPAAGDWMALHADVQIALLDGIVGLRGLPSDDGRTAADMRADLDLFRALLSFQLKDLDGTEYSVRIIGYSEEAIEPYDAAHPNGGRIAFVRFVKIP